MTPAQGRARLAALGLPPAAVEILWEHFDEAERRGKEGHGHARIGWLETQSFDAAARPVKTVATPGLDRWSGAGALGYLTLAAICDDLLSAPPTGARVVVAEACFPTGVLGAWARRLAEGGLVALVTATSPRRLSHPGGGPPLTGTNPIAIGVPSTEGQPVVTDVSMGAVTHGAVLAGRAQAEELVPFGGPQSHKAFALAVGVQLLVDALAGPEPGAVVVVARPEHDPVPGLRALAGDRRLPGDGV
jgi:L-2-hydroxycarboxylate dehydrogenase (NAD+)